LKILLDMQITPIRSNGKCLTSNTLFCNCIALFAIGAMFQAGVAAGFGRAWGTVLTDMTVAECGTGYKIGYSSASFKQNNLGFSLLKDCLESDYI